MGFSGAGWADEQDVGRGFEVAAGGQVVDQGSVDTGGGVDVEVVEGGRGGDAGKPQPPGQSAGGVGVVERRLSPLHAPGWRGVDRRGQGGA